ncbi:SMI1/KNR4 family protein, partial [Roseateles toxinivorans]|uniref:SMI1/KNR4 family protein n=1 Tax=Roseateles toxinivorans TaxID=270368 RepID=UPI001AAD27A7
VSAGRTAAVSLEAVGLNCTSSRVKMTWPDGYASSEIERIESKVGTALPEDLKVWLLSVGYGDDDETLSFRYDWFSQIRQGHLRGAVIFAQDDLGNLYAYTKISSNIVFLPRSTPEYADVAPSFLAFMEELERRDFKLGEWVDGLPCLPYERDA